MSKRDDEDRFVPIDPQEYLTTIEALESMRCQTISKQTHALLMVAVAQAFAAAEHEPTRRIPPEWFLGRVHTWLEYVLEGATLIEAPEELWAEVRRLRQATDQWQEHFSRSS